MEQNQADLHHQLAALKESFSQLIEELAQAATDLQDVGVLPSEDLVKDLTVARTDFATLRVRAFELAESLSIKDLPMPDEIVSISDLESLLKAVREAEKEDEVRQYTLIVLESVLEIVHSENAEFPPLLECQAKARELHQTLTDPQANDLDSNMKEAFAEGKDPFSALVTWIQSGEELPDERWAEFDDTVTQSFGRSLAVAAARGKLQIEVESDVKRPVKGDETASAGKKESQDDDVAPTSVSEEDISKTSEREDEPPTATTASTEKQGDTTTNDPSIEEIEEEVEKQPPTGPSSLDEISLYRFSPEDTAQQIASFILGGCVEERPVAIRDLIWRLLYEDKLCLALHLTQRLEDRYSTLSPHLHSWLIRSVLLGQNVLHSNGEIALLLSDDFSHFRNDSETEGEWKNAIQFLLAAAALRPALLAPETGAPSILHLLQVNDGLSQLGEYCQIIADHGGKFQPIDLNALKSVNDMATWQSNLDSLRQEVEDWYARAPQMTMNYAPATQIWRKWLEANGIIHSLLSPVMQNNPNQLEAAKNQVNLLSDENQIRREVDRTDQSVRTLRRKAITATALNQLNRNLRKAVGFVSRWIYLQESRPDQDKSYYLEDLDRLKQEIFSRHKAVIEELNSCEPHNTSLLLSSGIACLQRSLESIQILFDPEIPFPMDEPNPTHLLYADLLRTPLPMDEHWEPEISNGEEIVDAILSRLSDGEMDWHQAFEMRRSDSLRDHEATGRIIEYLEANPKAASLDIDALKQAREKHIRDCQNALIADLEFTRQTLENAVAFGLIREKERVRYAAEIDNIEQTIPQILRFREKHDELQFIRQKIEAEQAREIEGVRERLKVTDIKSDSPEFKRICQALEEGDVLTANEYIDMVKAGKEIPSPEEKVNAFDDFFSKYPEIENYLDRTTPPRNPAGLRQIIQNVSRGRSLGPIQMRHVPGAQARQAAKMLEAWFTTKRTESVTEERAEKILTHLGFNPLQITKTQSGRNTWINVKTEPIRSRNQCPVPIYGSNSNGQYRTLCVWDRPSEEDLLNDIGDTSYGAAAMVFHFGRMTEKRRRDLARLCREYRRTFIVIDDTLMLHLCGVRGSRLPILFKCALPFTFLEPYTTTAGLVPPEMFYGRQRERDSIIDPMGSCFIYGGRQLGKTALLRDVERTFHSPQEERVAVWLDLKVEGIGYDRSVDEIWHLLARVMKKQQIVPDNLPDHTSPDKLLGHIQTWLEQVNRRRILLLLDEADRFLEFDGEVKTEQFVRAARLKGLMDRTNRRFKIVFAGLHNVQRTTKLANHPLAHFGEPICIGPLLDNGESREARALIEHPLESLGYRFESPDLATRILSQTNYYPSLIQLYCSQLLKHVTSPHMVTFDPKESPPYLITSEHLKEAYQSQELRNSIRQRFNLTLQLDQRYEVIAYAIAYSCLEDGRGMVEGLPVSWFQDEAIPWWPEGFRGASEEDIRALLDEMVGLGVLRVVAPDRYSLRSPNVGLLMGTQEEIEAQLQKSRDDLPDEYEPANFRSAYHVGDQIDSSRRSPLTAHQESELKSRKNGVSIIFGCEAAGLNELEPFSESAFGKEFVTCLNNITDRLNFVEHLNLLSQRQRDGTTILLVLPTCIWDSDWIEAAIGKVEKLKSKTSFVRVAFVGTPQITWQLVSHDSTAFNALQNKRVTFLSLKPWHDAALRQWLDDCGFPSDKQTREKITGVTGNWPILLQSFYELSKSDPHRLENHLEKLAELLKLPDLAEKWAHSLGFGCHEPRQVIRDLANWDEAVSAEDLTDIVDETVSAEWVQQSIRWAELLSLVNRTGREKWSVNPVVGHILNALAE